MAPDCRMLCDGNAGLKRRYDLRQSAPDASDEVPIHCNPHAERFVETIRDECLDHFVIFGERHLRYLIKQYIEHYLTERFHQGIGSHCLNRRPMATG
jgi:hypothetical protein